MTDSTRKNIQAARDLLVKEGEDPEQFFPSCIGCGYCCIQATCYLGVQFWGHIHPCPGLYWDTNRYMCKLADEFPDKLYIGVGCCSPKNTWRNEVKERCQKP